MTEKGGYFPSYHTLGDLRIKFDLPEDVKAENYLRKLDLETAVETVKFKADGVTYTREYFASHPHKVIVGRRMASKPPRKANSPAVSRSTAADPRKPSPKAATRC